MLRRKETVAIDEEVREDTSELRAANERLLQTPLRGLRREPLSVAKAEPVQAEALRGDPEPAPLPVEPTVEVPPMPAPASAAAPRFTPKADEGRQARRGMDALREQALQNLISQVEDRNFGGLRNRRVGRGMMTPSRVLLVSVALIAGGIAAYLAVNLQPAPQPAPVPVETVVSVPMVKVLIAGAAIPQGQRIDSAVLEWTEWPEASVRPEFLTDAARPAAPDELQGAMARIDIAAGEPILETKLVKTDGSYLAGVLASGMRGVSVPVTAEAASGGFIGPNDRVDVISTRIMATGQVTETILSNVRVLALNNRLAEQEAGGSAGDAPPSPDAAFSGKALATLELNGREAELIVDAQAVGSLTLVLRSAADTAPAEDASERAANQAIRASSPFWTR